MTPTHPADAVQAFKWPNGCDNSVPAALRYLARNPRPSGGEDLYNGMHLLQLADEIESAVKASRAPVAAIPPAGDAVLTAANRYHQIKRHAFNKTCNGFTGEVLQWTLTMPASESDPTEFDIAVDEYMTFYGDKPHYVTPTATIQSQPDASELPPLPEPDGRFNINGTDGHRIKGWREGSMRDYVLADRAARQPSTDKFSDEVIAYCAQEIERHMADLEMWTARQPLPTKGAPTEQVSIGNDAEFKRHQLRVAIAISESNSSEEYAPCVTAWTDLIAYIMQWADARNPASAKDSERYRFIRDAGELPMILIEGRWYGNQHRAGLNLDDAIDAAIATTKATK